MHSENQFHKSLFRIISTTFAVAMAIVLALTVLASAAQAQTYTVIHNFTGGADGAAPLAGLTMDRTGNLYGTASYGGNPGRYGVVFMMSKHASSWIFNPLYSFTGGSDGDSPQAGVLIGPDGGLYGTTLAAGGGGDCRYQGEPPGCGTVFNLRPPAHVSPNVLGTWTETTIHAFNGHGDGAYPLSGLVFDEAGNLYGTTSANDGSELHGLVYKLTPSDGGWAENTLHTFTGSDGSYPAAGVIFDRNGNLYGTTVEGGAYGYGTVFQLTRSGIGWTENVLYNFDWYGADGGQPVGGLIFDQQGNLYGTTTLGHPGPSVFMLSPSQGGWMFTVLYNGDYYFGGSNAALVLDAAGNLYGTTEGGGALGYGTVFKLTPGAGGWAYTALHEFTGSEGGGPRSNVILDASGSLYGTTRWGGTGSACTGGCGVVWEITP
jgi:uncharacterized repeat protein (TIGR03803 family)